MLSWTFSSWHGDWASSPSSAHFPGRAFSDGLSLPCLPFFVSHLAHRRLVCEQYLPKAQCSAWNERENGMQLMGGGMKKEAG